MFADKKIGRAADCKVHRLRSELSARQWLIATHGTAAAPQFVLRDKTAGETYPASRFLFGEPLSNGRIVPDINKAINPPCTFSPHAVLPPPQNVLPFRIEAGELNAAG